MKKNKMPRNQLAMKGGSYSLFITVVVLAILIVVNIFASTLPATLTKLDISSSQLYSITSNTKVVVNNLQQDVTIYWIVQADEEDEIVENLLNKYEGLSSHIDVVKKNPDVFPTFAEQYTDETVANNSLIVESGDRYRYIPYEDVYEYEASFSYYTYSYEYTVTAFDGESVITSAIDYVVTEDLPVLYLLEGHGESEMSATFAEAIEKANIVTDTLSLLTVDEVPEDADAILIYAPESDISEEEKDILADYADNGGKLMVVAGPLSDTELTNLNSLLEYYGVSVAEGIVIEESRDHYAFGYPYVLMPELVSSDITDPLIEENYYAIMPLAQGLIVNDSTNVTTLLSTSDAAFSKVDGFALTTYEKEDEDIDGAFALAVSIDTGNDGRVVWFSSGMFLEDGYNSYSSGANVNLAMNALSSLIGEREAISIRSKSMNYNYLTISDSTSSTIKTLMIGVFPLTYLVIGILVILNERRKQNEKV